MKNTGIWLDKNKALIVTIENGREMLTTITSNVEHYHAHGGSGAQLKGGPQDVIQDSKYLERENHQLKVSVRATTGLNFPDIRVRVDGVFGCCDRVSSPG